MLSIGFSSLGNFCLVYFEFQFLSEYTFMTYLPDELILWSLWNVLPPYYWQCSLSGILSLACVCSVFSHLLLLTKLVYLSVSLVNIMVVNGLHLFRDSLRIIREHLGVSALSQHVITDPLAEWSAFRKMNHTPNVSLNAVTSPRCNHNQ